MRRSGSKIFQMAVAFVGHLDQRRSVLVCDRSISNKLQIYAEELQINNQSQIQEDQEKNVKTSKDLRKDLNRKAFRARKRKKEIDAWKKCAELMQCPLSLSVPDNPVMVMDENSVARVYDEHWIRTWLSNNQTCPLARTRIKSISRPLSCLRELSHQMSVIGELNGSLSPV